MIIKILTAVTFGIPLAGFLYLWLKDKMQDINNGGYVFVHEAISVLLSIMVAARLTYGLFW